MADLLWDDVKSFFDPDLMESLPDVVVPETSVEDWQAVLDLVGVSDWMCKYSEGETVLLVPRAEAVLSRPADAECAELRVWPTAVGVQANMHSQVRPNVHRGLGAK